MRAGQFLHPSDTAKYLHQGSTKIAAWNDTQTNQGPSLVQGHDNLG